MEYDQHSTKDLIDMLAIKERLYHRRNSIEREKRLEGEMYSICAVIESRQAASIRAPLSEDALYKLSKSNG